MKSSAAFSAEHLLKPGALPDYETELCKLKGLLAIASFLWLLVLPYSLSSKRTDSKKSRVPCCSGTLGIAGFFATNFVMISFLNPHNTITRKVFQVPILSEAECQRVIDMAFVAAENNMLNLESVGVDDNDMLEEQKLMFEEPKGWQKLRHRSVPTTDLNLVTDAFVDEDREWLKNVANMRLAPILSRIYGIPARSIQAKDMFVVRYDAGTARSELKKHYDGGDISFSIFLNSGFEGGGTRFWNTATGKPFAHIQSDVPGLLSTFPAQVFHEGVPITKGRRMILVGFLDIMRYEQDEKTTTGLTLFATYFNFNYVLPRIKEWYSEFEWPSNGLRMRVYRVLRAIGDWHERTAVHAAVPNLIAHTHKVEFLSTLDKSYDDSNSAGKAMSSARWLEGQQLSAIMKAFKNWADEEADYYDDKENVDDKGHDPYGEEKTRSLL